jgi:hypothetical protein
MPIDPVAVAEAAAGSRVSAARVTTRVPIEYDPFLAGRTVERVAGVAKAPGGALAHWSAVVKRTSGVDLRPARRELAAYREGIASARPSVGLRAPALLGWDAGPTDVELWLEDVADQHDGRWPVARFAVAAAHIAAWDLRAAERGMPAAFDAEDAWAERHGQPHRVGEALAQLTAYAGEPAAEEVAVALADPGFDRTHALIRSTQRRIDDLATYPQTPLHHDLVRSNLFAVDATTTVAIDWENVGRGPLGVDLAPLVIGSVRRGEAAADDLGAIEASVLEAYLRAMPGGRIDRDTEIRRTYRLAVALRWHHVLGAIGAWLGHDAGRLRGSRPDEPRSEALRHITVVARHVLDAGEPLR